MKKILLLAALLLSLAACDQKDDDDELSELRQMVQAPAQPEEASSEAPN